MPHPAFMSLIATLERECSRWELAEAMGENGPLEGREPETQLFKATRQLLEDYYASKATGKYPIY
jgi:hypothetical protein